MRRFGVLRAAWFRAAALTALLAAPAAVGQVAPAVQLADLRTEPEPRGSDPRSVMVTPTHVFAVAYVDGGTRLLAADRASGATTLSLRQDPYWEPTPIAVLDGDLVFHTVAEEGGQYVGSLWTSDGTPGGTVKRADAVDSEGRALSFAEALVVGGRLFVVLNGGIEANEPRLWTSGDGGETYEELLYIPGTAGFGRYFAQLTAFDGHLWFTVDGQLWRSDGSVSGTRSFAASVPGLDVEYVSYFAATQTALWFGATDAHGDGFGTWTTDGTPAGTHRLADLVPGSPAAAGYPIGAAGGFVYLNVPDASDEGSLWRTDGTAAGTHEIVPMPDPTFVPEVTEAGPMLDPRVVGAIGDRLIFTAGRPSWRDATWWVDASSVSATLLADVVAATGPDLPLDGPWNIAVGRLVFAALGPDLEPSQLWVTDGTPGGTSRVADLGHASFPTFSPRPHTSDSDGISVWFVGKDEGAGSELFVTDGTPEGTRLAANFQADVGSSSPEPWAVLPDPAGARLVFAATGDGVGREPFVTDGTPAGTHLLLDVNPGESPSNATFLGLLPGGLVFAADDGVHGNEPWITDGTPAGTRLLRDVRPGAAGSAPVLGYTPQPEVVSDRVVLFADDGVRGREPWATDGTPAGTRVLRDVRPDRTSGAMTPMSGGQRARRDVVASRLGMHVFFRSDDGGLWRTDGTASGTRRELPPGLGFPRSPIVAAEGRIGFLTRPPRSRGREGFVLRTHDAARGRTTRADIRDDGFSVGRGAPATLPIARRWLIRGFNDGELSSLRLGASHRPVTELGGDANPFAPTDAPVVAGDRAFLERGFGGSLWTSDGTPGGTLPVPGTESRDPYEIAALGSSGRVTFLSRDAVRGEEAWVSDGTPAGTFPFADVVPDASSGELSGFTAVGSRIFFAAEDFVTRREPWAVHASAALPQCVIDTDGDRIPDVVEAASPTGDPAVPDAGVLSCTGDLVVTRLTSDLHFGDGDLDWVEIEGWWDAPSRVPLGDAPEIRVCIGGFAVSGRKTAEGVNPFYDGSWSDEFVGRARVHRMRFRVSFLGNVSEALAELGIDGASDVTHVPRVVPIFGSVGGHIAKTARTVRFTASAGLGTLGL